MLYRLAHANEKNIFMEKNLKETDIKHHQSVLQADELSRAMYHCSILGRKIIAFSVSRIQEKKTDTTPFYPDHADIFVPAAEFKISELLKSLNMNASGENYLRIKDAIKELRTAGIEIYEHDSQVYHAYNWFQSLHYNKAKDKIELIFNDQIGLALYELKDGYTVLNLQIVGELKSFYAFRYYEIALSWIGMKGKKGNAQGSWWFQLDPDTIRQTFKIPADAYKSRMNNFFMWVVRKPIEELNKVNQDFQISITKIMRGRDLAAFRFNCTETQKESNKITIKKTDNEELKTIKNEINTEEEMFAKLKQLHPERWNTLYDEELKKPDKIGGIFFAENNAKIRLLKEFKDELSE